MEQPGCLFIGDAPFGPQVGWWVFDKACRLDFLAASRKIIRYSVALLFTDVKVGAK